MKSTFVAAIAASMTLLYACNNQPAATQKEEQATTTEAAADTDQVAVVKASFTNVDAGVATYIKSLAGNYLQVKNALTDGKPGEAATAAKNINEAVKGFDKSLLSAEQKKVYDQTEAGLKEHADNITKAAANIEQQRSQFAQLSQDVYTLVKAFGSGKTLYHDHCPMAMNNKGAMWLSETKDIKNPYYGSEMLECGSVEEELQ
jgi:hypothetical protein